MIEVSQMYKDTLASGTRNFNAIINITLEDGTRLPNLTNADLRAFSIDDAVSDDNSFTMLGSTIINQCSITLDNLSGKYFQYNFKYADVVVYIDYPLLDGTVERIRKGTFYVDDDKYVGGTVELTCFDNLAKLDKDYAASKLDYPATIEDIILDACNVCGIEFSHTKIPYSDFLVPAKPIKEQTTFRQVVGWAAQIVGCYVRCDTYGRLELNWCNLTALEEAYGSLDGGTFDSSTPYETGDIADGGRFNPWNVGYIISSATLESQSESHQFYYNYTQDIAIEDTLISGVTIVVDSKVSDTEDSSYSVGSDGYVITIEKNELITADIAQQVVTLLGDKLIGMRFRKASTNHMSDPTIEAGDIAVLWDTKNRSYPIIVTRTNFKIGSQQRTVCGVESPTKNSATRYTETAKAYLRIKEALRTEKTSREQAVNNLATRLAASSGLYSTIETTESGNIYYLHDRPDLDDSQIIWKMTAEAWGVSSDGGQTWNGGMTVDGDTIVRILSAVGIDADWIRTGIIKDRNGLNYINLDNGNLQFRSSTSKAYINFTNAVIETYNTWAGTRGVAISDNKVQFYNWDSAGQLTAYLTSTADNAKQYFGAAFVKPYASRYVGFAYDVEGDELNTYYGLCLYGSETNDPILRSYLPHKFRNSLALEGYTGTSYKNFLTLSLRNTDNGAIKLAGVCSNYMNIAIGEVPSDRDGIIISSKSVRNTLGLSDSEYSNVTIIDDVTISGGYDLILASGGSHLQLNYGSQSGGSVDLYAWPRNGELCVHSTGGLSCSGTKNRIVATKEYGEIALSAYETTTPYFADIGSGTLDTDGICYIELDNVFLATINTDMEYFVFLQKEGPGDIWVADKQKTYFEVKGTPNLKFAWEIKARQRGYEKHRLERSYDTGELTNLNYDDLGYSEYVRFINQISNFPDGEDNEQ